MATLPMQGGRLILQQLSRRTGYWIASKTRKLSLPRIYPVDPTSDLQIGIPVLPLMGHHEIV